MAAGKPQNLLVPLIVSVVITVASGVTAFLFYQKATKLDTELTSAKDAKTKADTAKSTADASLRILKEKIGFPDASDFGSAQDAASSGSLMASINNELTRYNDPKDPPSQTFKEELARLNLKAENTAKELATKSDAFNTLMADFQTKRKVEADKINEH